jgi:hypothetical protein
MAVFLLSLMSFLLIAASCHRHVAPPAQAEWWPSILSKCLLSGIARSRPGPLTQISLQLNSECQISSLNAATGIEFVNHVTGEVYDNCPDFNSKYFSQLCCGPADSSPCEICQIAVDETNE